MRRRDAEKFKQCKHCYSMDTKMIEHGSNDKLFFYFGWCMACKDHYEYTVFVETVRDRKGRL